MPCHEEQFDVVLVARQRLIEQLKDLCKSFQVPSALKIQDPRQSVVYPDQIFAPACASARRAGGVDSSFQSRLNSPGRCFSEPL
jgi:hypothetical protein